MANILKSFNRVTTLSPSDQILKAGSQSLKFSGNVSTNVSGEVVEVSVGTGSGVAISDNANTYNVSEIKFLGNVNVVNNGGIGEVTISPGSFDALLNGVSVNSSTTALNIVSQNVSVVDAGGGQVDIGIDTETEYSLNGASVLSSQLVNFFGQVNITDNGGVADVEILGSTNTVKEGGVNVSTSVDTFNFVGASVSNDGGGQVTISINPNAPTANPNTFTWFDGSGILSGTTQETSYIEQNGTSAVFFLKPSADSNINPVSGAASGNRMMGIAGDSNTFSSGNINSAIVNTQNVTISGSGIIERSYLGGFNINMTGGVFRNAGVFASQIDINSGSITNSVLVGRNGLLSSGCLVRGSFVSGFASSESGSSVLQSLRLFGGEVILNGPNTFNQSIVSMDRKGGATHDTLNIRNSIFITNGNTNESTTNLNLTNSYFMLNQSTAINDLSITDKSIVSAELSVSNSPMTIRKSLIAGGTTNLDNINSSGGLISLGDNSFKDVSGLEAKFLIGEVSLDQTVEPRTLSKIGYASASIDFKNHLIKQDNISFRNETANINSSLTFLNAPQKSLIKASTTSTGNNLSQMSAGEDGFQVTIFNEGVNSFDIFHNQGTGSSFFLTGSTSVTMTQGSTLTLMYMDGFSGGGKWVEIARSIK